MSALELTADPCEAELALQDLRRAAERVAALPWLTMSKRQLADAVVELQSIAATVDAIMAEVSAEAHAAAVHLLDGQLGLPAFVAGRSNVDPRRVAGDRNLGQWLQSFPVLGDAFRDGRITRAHVGVLRQADNTRTHRDLVDAQQYLVEAAETASWVDFVEVMRAWMLAADPDGNEPAAQVDKRELKARTLADGMVKGAFLLDPLEGELFLNALAQEEQRLRRGESDDADITPGQRRADAMVSLVGRGATRPDGTVAAPLVHITMSDRVAQDLLIRLAVEAAIDDPYERRAALMQLGLDPYRLPLDPSSPDGRCHLADGTPIHPRFAVAALAVGTLRKLVLSADNEVLELGRSVRDFPRYVKDAVISVQKGRCAHAGCDAPVAWLQADHRHPWNRDGRTDIGNCDGLCDPHNKKKTDLVPP